MAARRLEHRGFALLAVLWIVAAMSIVVSGLVMVVRNETQSVARERQKIMALGVGEAAIALALQDLRSRQERIDRATLVQTTYQGVSVTIEVMPLTGLININRAPRGLLQLLYAVAGGLSAGQAEALSDATIQYRSQREGVSRLQRGFESESDLMQVPGMHYELYARLAPLVTADRRDSGAVNPMAAPLGVLNVLAEGNLARAQALLASRDAGQPGIDTTGLSAEHIGPSATTRYRFLARVPMADGAFLFVSRSIDLTAGSSDGLSWQILNAQHWTQEAEGSGV